MRPLLVVIVVGLIGWAGFTYVDHTVTESLFREK
ncbi:hypothetical protein OB2597_06670 [Pseudooceanicola batsensis HTCC2597]|uniref:Uncharacterized protein n=1 Tax=Pseudooceanicola batsensis (strain ATCC BAA-863 / DSM 15984 / KCTC 12145 / HTCC2597) TaxID=252305 RepID=A3TTG9_PSEBH|nr:hypothetical protein OB2597_06670 [Pseudooceanicola batsensis HTCC2597]